MAVSRVTVSMGTGGGGDVGDYAVDCARNVAVTSKTTVDASQWQAIDAGREEGLDAGKEGALKRGIAHPVEVVGED